MANDTRRRLLLRRFFYSLALSAFLGRAADGANGKLGAPPAPSARPISLSASLRPPLPQAPVLPQALGGILPAAVPVPVLAPQAAAAGQLEAALPDAQGAQQPSPSDARRLDAVFDGAAVPATRRDESVVDDYHGTPIADPYRWLEDDAAAETKAWVQAQNVATESVLAGIPERAAIAAQLKKDWNYARYSMPTKIGGWWIYSRNDGLQNQSVLYKSRTLYGTPEVLLDPNTLSSDGTVSLSGMSFSNDGKHMAYAVSEAGSDWTHWRVKGVTSGLDTEDRLEWTKFTHPSWDEKGGGFWYTRYPEPAPGDEKTAANAHSKVYYHALGTPQSEDVLVHEDPENPYRSFSAGLTGDGRFLVMYQHEGTESKNRVYVKDLSKPGAPFVPLFDAFDAEYTIVGNDGETFYVQTTRGAPRGKLVAVELRHPQPRYWNTIIKQGPGKDVLESVVKSGDRFIASWMIDVKSALRVYGPRGGFKYEVALPGAGSASNWKARSSGETTQGFITFTSFNHPSTNFRLNLETGKLRRYRAPKIGFDFKKYEVKQVFYESKDGTRVPMFIVHKKGLKLDGSNPTYLYGYGGFSISMLPSFSIGRAAWLERGGVWAMPNLRGGAEYGEEWHDAGRLGKKQNVFDDFIAAAEYLIREKYTQPKRLAIGGGSNGGLLVGAVMTQRPDLFAAAVPQVGVLDMLRYHLFTVGRGWAPEYGTSETKEGFDTLIKYSPLHNVRPGAPYPATMVMTGDHDDRVVPAHSHKFTAALQAAQAPGAAPILTRVELNAGHGAGKPTEMIIQEIADMWAFLLKALGVSSSNGPPA